MSASLMGQAVPVNPASFATPGLPNGDIAQGSLFEIFASGDIATNTLTQAGSFPLPTNLEGTSVQVTVGGQTVDCFVVRTFNDGSQDRVAAILPSTTPLGSGTLTVSFNGQASAPSPITVVAHSFGMFTLNSAGNGPAIVLDPVGGSFNTVYQPFEPGDIADIYGTGLGALPEGQSDDILPTLTNLPYDVKVMVGDKEAQVTFKGRDAGGCCAAIDLVRFIVPDVSGCYVPVQVLVGGVPSNFGSMSVSPSGECSDPGEVGGAYGDLLSQAEGSGEGRVGAINLSRVKVTIDGINIPFQSFSTNNDIASAQFLKYNFEELRNTRGLTDISYIGACTVIQFSGDEAAEDPTEATAEGLDAGTLTIVGPNGSEEIPQQFQEGFYFKAFIDIPGFPGGIPGFSKIPTVGQFGSGGGFLDPGNYTVNGSGGSDVGSFAAQITISQQAQTNISSLSNIPRGQALRVTYSNTTGADYVGIQGASIRMNGNNQIGAGFFCRANPSAGFFDVPAGVLSLLPASQTQEGIPTGNITIGIGSETLFNASGLDFGVITQFDAELKNVNYQ